MTPGRASAASEARSPGAKAARVRIEGVNVFYGTNHVLKDVHLDIRPGEFFAFLGPSGCGKTTLLRLIAGFNRAETGRVLVDGADISRVPPWRRDVGLVFQSYALWPHMTVRANVAFGLEERRLPRAEVSRRVGVALAMFGLEDYADRYPSELSGGQQQRVAVARTVVVEPKVLLLDEPLSNLDAKLREQVRRELRGLQRRIGITTIFVTHDQEEANTMCDRLAVMRDGVVQQVGTPVEMYARPANLFVASFLGTANILPGEIIGVGTSRVFRLPAGAAIPVPIDAEIDAGAKLVFRPQDARLGPDEGVGLVGVLLDREFLGSAVRYRVLLAGAEIAVEAPFTAGDRLYHAGERVGVSVAPSALFWLTS